MRTSKPIHIVVHKPSDMDAFEKIYIDAAFEAIKQLAQTMPKGTGCKPEKKSKPSKTK
ncbi:MAG: hypothetical protein ACI4YB_08660 [Oscillospiraceae bacterium]